MTKKTYSEEVSVRLVEFGQRLFGTDYGWKTKFATALGMLPQGLQPYLTGRLPGNTILARLNKLGCSSDWLLYGDTHDAESGSIALMNVPVYDSLIQGNKESIVMETIIDYIAIPKNPDQTLFGIKVKTESMAPCLKPGDIVIVSEKIKMKSGDVCLVQGIDGRYMLRFVHIQGDQYLLIAENAEHFPPQSIPRNKIKQILRVMKMIRSL